jgi:hypothetical protein
MAEDQDIPISHLQRRRIEGRVLVPFIQACSDMFGEDAARKLVTATICRLAAADGANWAESHGRDLDSVRRIAENVWGGGDLDIDVGEQTKDRLFFNITRCRYAEFYIDLHHDALGFVMEESRHIISLQTIRMGQVLLRRRGWHCRSTGPMGPAL